MVIALSQQLYQKKNAILVIIIFTALFYGWIWFLIDDLRLLASGNAVFSIIAGIIAMYWLVRTNRILPTVHKRFIYLISIGLFLFLISNLIWFIHLQTGDSTDFPLAAEIFWFLADMFFLAALIHKLRLLYRSISIAPFLFNIIIFMIVAGTLSLHYLINPIEFIANQYLALGIFNLIYPIFDLIFVFIIINIYYMTKNSKEKKTYFFLTLGFLLQVITDTVYSILLIYNQFSYSILLDPLWTLAILLIGYSAFYVEKEKEETTWQFKSIPNIAKDNNLILVTSVIFLTMVVIHRTGWRMDLLIFGLTLSVILIVMKQIVMTKKYGQLLEELWYYAYHDKLTKLYNRPSFLRDMEELITFSSKRNKTFAVMLIDFDRFKNINDTLGHDIGNQLLRKCGKQLIKSINEKDRVYRLGGDEFTIILQNASRQEAITVSERVFHLFSKPLIVEQYQISIKPSIGISMFPDNGMQTGKLLKNADISMYLAKNKGGNQYQFYNKELNYKVQRRMMLEHDLNLALEHKQLLLHYQPKVNLHTRKIIGVEALLRWKHPELGYISPTEFIPIAEDTGQIVPIGDWVFSHACRQLSDWHQKGYNYLTMAVNISARQFKDNEFINNTQKTIDELGIKPCDIELELTESIMKNKEESTKVLKELKEIGVRTSIDDFGTGYSSLSVLKGFPIDAIKIDRSFIHELSEKDKTVMKTIINIGFNLKLDVIVEGIEIEQQVEALLSITDRLIYGQGYLFGKPLVAEEVEKLF